MLPLKHWYPTTLLHSITTQKTMTLLLNNPRNKVKLVFEYHPRLDTEPATSLPVLVFCLSISGIIAGYYLFVTVCQTILIFIIYDSWLLKKESLHGV
jgi:hypothetical protein